MAEATCGGKSRCINTLLCEICKQETNKKYKCSICYIRYCSVPCYKLHKENPCVKISSPEKEDPHKTTGLTPNEQIKLEDKTNCISETILQRLGKSDELVNTLNNPDLRKILTWVSNSKDYQKAIHTAMMEPIFVDFVTECLKVTENVE